MYDTKIGTCPWCPPQCSVTGYLEVVPVGILGTAGPLVDPSLPGKEAAKPCITVVMCPFVDDLSGKLLVS